MSKSESCPSPKYEVGESVFWNSGILNFLNSGVVVSRKIHVGWFYSGWLYVVKDDISGYREVKESNLWSAKEFVEKKGEVK